MADGPASQRVGSRYLSVAYRVRKVLDEHMIQRTITQAVEGLGQGRACQTNR
jgi:hypothetical protein